jgi:hypothetical protein
MQDDNGCILKLVLYRVLEYVLNLNKMITRLGPWDRQPQFQSPIYKNSNLYVMLVIRERNNGDLQYVKSPCPTYKFRRKCIKQVSNY